MKNRVRKLTIAGVLIALGVLLSAFYIPIGASKCFPIQHMVNVIAAVTLGPGYGVSMAFATSLIRVLMGTGSLLAFPGSMVGALCCGLAYRFTHKLSFTFAGEVIGTGILGAIAAWPVAEALMGTQAALFAYVLPFMISSFGGAAISVLILGALEKTHVLSQIRLSLNAK